MHPYPAPGILVTHLWKIRVKMRHKLRQTHYKSYKLLALSLRAKIPRCLGKCVTDRHPGMWHPASPCEAQAVTLDTAPATNYR